MATMGFAMWLQDADLASTNHLIMIFIGLVAVAMAAMAIAMIVVAAISAKAIKGMNATVAELKGKVLPLIDVATDISKTSRAMMQDAAPKVKHITENLVTASDTLAETSKAARTAVAAVRRHDFRCEHADAASGSSCGRHGDGGADHDGRSG